MRNVSLVAPLVNSIEITVYISRVESYTAYQTFDMHKELVSAWLSHE